jgi:prolyl-tRNA editing enzyme YbaK/EbsC (Cys-tRNA(Pro) deacylase)
MHPRAEAFADRAAEEYGLAVEISEFTEGTKTAAAAADAVDCEVDQIASSLVFEVGDEPVVAVTSGANRVSERRLAEHFDVDADEVTMADPETIRETLGWSIGGVPPVCHETDVPVLFDPHLTEFDAVWAAAGTPQSMWPVDPDRLRRLADATVADVTE